MLSATYLSTTTVTPSVATTSSDKMGQFLHQGCKLDADAQNTPTPIEDGRCM